MAEFNVEDFVSVEDGKLTVWTSSGDRIEVQIKNPVAAMLDIRTALGTWPGWKPMEWR